MNKSQYIHIFNGTLKEQKTDDKHVDKEQRNIGQH